MKLRPRASSAGSVWHTSPSWSASRRLLVMVVATVLAVAGLTVGTPTPASAAVTRTTDGSYVPHSDVRTMASALAASARLEDATFFKSLMAAYASNKVVQYTNGSEVRPCHVDGRFIAGLYQLTEVDKFSIKMSDTNRWCDWTAVATSNSATSYHWAYGGGAGLDIKGFSIPANRAYSGNATTYSSINYDTAARRADTATLVDRFFVGANRHAPAAAGLKWQVGQKGCAGYNYTSNNVYSFVDACNHIHISYSANDRTYPKPTGTQCHCTDFSQVNYNGGIPGGGPGNQYPVEEGLTAKLSGQLLSVSGSVWDPNSANTLVQVRVTHTWNLAGVPYSEVKTTQSKKNQPFQLYFDITSGETHGFLVEAKDLTTHTWEVVRALSVELSPNFNGNVTLTRGQVAEYLYRYSNDPLVQGNLFDGHANEAALNWMLERGLSGTFSGTSAPEVAASRQAVAVFLYRMAGSTYQGPATPTFLDVPKTHPFYKEIEWLAWMGISTGYNDGTFRPAKGTSKTALVTMLYRLAGKPYVGHQGPRKYWDLAYSSELYDAARWADAEYITADRFSDMAPSAPFYTEVRWLAQNGYTSGYNDGTYRPGEPITRHALAAMLYKLAGEPYFSPPAQSPFSDVPTSHDNYKAITWMAATGISTGYDDGTFKPTAQVTRQAFAAFLYRAAGQPAYTPPVQATFTDVGTGHAFYKEIEWMASTGITQGYSDGTFGPSGVVNRGPLAAFLYRYSQHQAS